MELCIWDEEEAAEAAEAAEAWAGLWPSAIWPNLKTLN